MTEKNALSKRKPFEEVASKEAVNILKEQEKPTDHNVGNQITKVLTFLGRDDIDERGKIRDRHITKIISWIVNHPTGNYGDLIAQLGLICGIRWRYILEYLEGFRSLGLLDIQRTSHVEVYSWIGVKSNGYT